jgi:hypothetical protein
MVSKNNGVGMDAVKKYDNVITYHRKKNCCYTLIEMLQIRIESKE